MSSTQTLLRLGTVTTILAGTALVAAGQCDLLVFFCFMLVVTRLYDPINLILQSTAELIDQRESLARSRAIEQEPAQVGSVDSRPRVTTSSSTGCRFPTRTASRCSPT